MTRFFYLTIISFVFCVCNAAIQFASISWDEVAGARQGRYQHNDDFSELYKRLHDECVENYAQCRHTQDDCDKCAASCMAASIECHIDRIKQELAEMSQECETGQFPGDREISLHLSSARNFFSSDYISTWVLVGRRSYTERKHLHNCLEMGTSISQSHAKPYRWFSSITPLFVLNSSVVELNIQPKSLLFFNSDMEWW